MPTPVVHQFAYGPVNPIISFVMAFVGAQLGLTCVVRARRSASTDRRMRWQLLGALALGGGGVWLMHFMALLGFDVPDSPMRIDVPLTALSLVIAIGFMAVGLFIVGRGRPRVYKVLLCGALTGAGIMAMHFAGMAAVNIDGYISYDSHIVAASVIIAVAASTAALWFSVAVQGWASITAASAIFAVAVCAMHYTAMAAVRVHLSTSAEKLSGVEPIVLMVSTVIIAIAALIATVFVALGMMGEEEFALTVDRAAQDGGSRRLIHRRKRASAAGPRRGGRVADDVHDLYMPDIPVFSPATEE